MTTKLLPGQTLGIIGGNEIGKMMAIAAKQMGFKVTLLDPYPNCPAASIVDWHILAGYNSMSGLKQFAKKSHCITYATPHVTSQSLRWLSSFSFFPQNLDLIEITENRVIEKQFLESNNIVTAPYAVVYTLKDIQKAILGIGYPCILKTSHKVNDQKVILYSEKDLSQTLDLLKQDTCILESFIPKKEEIVLSMVKNHQGEWQLFPLLEQSYEQDVLQGVVLPAVLPEEVEEEAKKIAQTLAKDFFTVGSLTIELFVGKYGLLYVNQLYTYPTTSSFIYQNTCNFDLMSMHIKSICNWHLSPVYLLSKAVMMTIVRRQQAASERLIDFFDNAQFYYYNQADFLNEKKSIGHMTVLTKDINQTLLKLKETNIW